MLEVAAWEAEEAEALQRDGLMEAVILTILIQQFNPWLRKISNQELKEVAEAAGLKVEEVPEVEEAAEVEVAGRKEVGAASAVVEADGHKVAAAVEAEVGAAGRKEVAAAEEVLKDGHQQEVRAELK